MMTCREIVDFIMGYLNRELSEEEGSDFERHLAVCPPCVAYMKSYKEAVRLGKEALAPEEKPVPPEVPEELVQAILTAKKQARR